MDSDALSLDGAIARLEELFGRLTSLGYLKEAASVSYALAVLKRERGDYSENAESGGVGTFFARTPGDTDMFDGCF